MATLTLKPILHITMTIKDRSSTSSFEFNMGQTGGNFPPLQDAGFATYLAEFASSIEAVSDCQVTRISATVTWVVDAPVAFGTSPENERKGVFEFNTAGGYFGRSSVPGLAPAALANDGINIQRTGTVFAGTLAADLQSIHDKLQNGATVNLITYPVVDGSGRDYNGLAAAFQQHRKSLKARSQSGG